MAATTAPIKVDQATDELVSQAAHFMDMSKKQVVDLAVREFVERHRDEINEGVRQALQQLDGSRESRVALLAGMSREKIDELGGLRDSK